MTTSPQNTNLAISMLDKALHQFETVHSVPRAGLDTGFFIRILLDSLKKCFASLYAQIRFYQGATGTGRALIVPDGTGGEKVVRGLRLLRMPLPNLDRDAVIYGEFETLAAVSCALAKAGWPATGPETAAEIARSLGSGPPQKGNSAHV